MDEVDSPRKQHESGQQEKPWEGEESINRKLIHIPFQITQNFLSKSPQAPYPSISVLCAYTRRPNKYSNSSYTCMVSTTNELYFLLAFYSCNQLTLHVQFMLQFTDCSGKCYKHMCTGKWQNVLHFQRNGWDDKMSFQLCVTLSHCFAIIILLLYKLLFRSVHVLCLPLSVSELFG